MEILSQTNLDIILSSFLTKSKKKKKINNRFLCVPERVRLSERSLTQIGRQNIFKEENIITQIGFCLGRLTLSVSSRILWAVVKDFKDFKSLKNSFG